VFRALMASGRGTMKIIGVATQTVLRPLTKVVGGRIVDDAIEFFRAFDGMEAGFRERAVTVIDELTAPSTAWVLVTAPRPEPVAESVWFVSTLAANGITPSALVANRVQAAVPDASEVPALEGTEIGAFLGELSRLRAAQLASLVSLQKELPNAIAMIEVTERPADIHDLAGVTEMSTALGLIRA
jgi:hypothetical protein